MDQLVAVWILIVLALVSANLPFVVERPFLALPWAQHGEDRRPTWLRLLESLVFFALLAGLLYAIVAWVGGSLVMASDAASVGLFLFKLAVLAGAVVLLLSYPGWRDTNKSVHKSFFARLLEVLALYALLGALGFAFEINIGNFFAKNWEFYAITLSLYLVLGYPGFVYRYLLRHGRNRG